MSKLDFNKYDNIVDMVGYNGFIDRYGNFYKVSKTIDYSIRDSHNSWASEYLKEKLDISQFKFNPTNSALMELVSLNGPAEILVNCFGYVYYSHDFAFHKPIIKLPNPKIANYKVTEEQLNVLFFLMRLNNENVNIPIFTEEDVYTYEGQCDDSYVKKLKKNN